MAAGKVGLMADEMGGTGGTLDIGPLRAAFLVGYAEKNVSVSKKT